MKKIGLIGGLSWESTALYYAHLNRLTNQKLGGMHSAQLILISLDFAEIAELQRENRWKDSAEILAQAAIQLEGAGAEIILLCSNTMHKVIEVIAARVNVPILNIADCVALTAKSLCLQRLALFGTRFTMEDRFYADRLIQSGLEVVVPSEEQRDKINDVIFSELCRGLIRRESKLELQNIISDLQTRHQIDAVVLGCTELGLLLDAEEMHSANHSIRLLDSAKLHCEAAIHEAFAAEFDHHGT